MRIVIDASAVVAVLLNEDIRLTIVERTKGIEVVSPSTLPWEVGNALVVNVRRRRIEKLASLEAINNFHRMDIRLVDISLEDSILLANKLGIYAYDAYVLCCAQRLKIPLLTLDNQMIKSAMSIGIKILEIE